MKGFLKSVSLVLAILIMLSSIAVLSVVNIFAAGASISYSFANSKAGYAQGTITLKADDGKYYLYWADSTKALADYGEIGSVTVSAGQGSFTMPEYTAIPADAAKLIAVKGSTEPTIANRTVAKASAVYTVPSNKMLSVDTSDALYTFGAISDPQLANDSYGSGSYPYDETHFAKALETLANRNVNFTVSSGDTVNDQNGSQTYVEEFRRYQRLLADSSYCNPIYEANGNHDVGTVWDKNGNYYNDNTPFVTGTGLDSVKSTINALKPYFEITEPNTGDHFIFMALEGGFYTNKGTQFSKAQLDWLEGLLKKYNGDGKNIFIIEHANIGGWGSGDKLTTPYYYDLALVKTNSDVARFVKLMETYKDCVIITGHTHLELSAQYNYSDNNGTSAVMIHNSAIGGVRRLVNGSIDRTAVEGLSEGYIVEVYEDCILFNGTNLYYNETMPTCCYIVPMTTSENDNPEEEETTAAETEPLKDTVTITLKDMTDSGWMKNSASEREIQLIDNKTGEKYIMTSYDGYKSWSVEVSVTVTDITFKRVRTSDNVDRNVWSAGNRNGSVLYNVLDDAGGGTTVGAGYWEPAPTEKTEPVTTKPQPTSPKTDPDEKTVSTTAKADVTSVVTDNTEVTYSSTASATSVSTSVPDASVNITDPAEDTDTIQTDPNDSSAGETSTEIADNKPSASETKGSAVVTSGSEISSTPAESKPQGDGHLYGDADLNGKVNVKDATTVQKYVAKMIDLDATAYLLADVNDDLRVNIKDATCIQKLVAKIIDVFPVQENTLVSVGAVDPASFGSFLNDLEDYYTFSSYDQYMALKKACKKYEGKTMTSAILAELQGLRKALYDIAGEKPAQGGVLTVYFENTMNWSKVNIYAWSDGGGKNADWPGVAMTSVDENTYSYTFNYDDYKKIIFNNGTEQTVDIIHPGTNNVIYKISGGSGKAYTVSTDMPIG